MAKPKRSVAVFGGSGFLGRVVVRLLIQEGYAVRLVARRPDRAAPVPDDLVQDGLEPASFEAVCADIRDPDAVERAVDQVFGVVNAVGLYRERGAESFAAVHQDGAFTLADAAAKAGAGRVIHISGIGADPASPSSYVRARAEGERRARQGFPAATILRPSALFGPDGGLLASLDGLTRALPVFPLFGAGAMRLQPVHVADVAWAVLRALGDSVSAGRTYELGGPDVLSYRELVERVMAAHDRRRPFLPIPFGAWHLLARMLAPLPNAPVTVHQLALLARDNVVAPGALSLIDLGVEPTPLAVCLPPG